MKVKEEENIISKKIKKIVNNNKSKPLDRRKKQPKKKLQISKTLSTENISIGPKYTTRQKSLNPSKFLNNSVEEFDYLNFSDIDIDLFKKNSSCEKDIFKPLIMTNNNNDKKEIVQNRYNMVDTSFDTNIYDDINNKVHDEYIDINKNLLVKTPSTICNYYDIDSEKKNIINNKISEEKKLKKNIHISNNCIINYNNPIFSNRTKMHKHNSSSNMKLFLQNNKNIYTNTNVNFYKGKKNINNIKTTNKKPKIKNDKTSILKDKNKDSGNKIQNKVKYNNNLMKSYLEGNNNNKTSKKCLSIKQYSGYITSQVIKNNKKSNCNFTFNNDITSYLQKQQNPPDLFNSIKEIKEIKETIYTLNINTNEEEKNCEQKQKKPVMLYLNKHKFNSCFITPKNSNSEKKEKEKEKNKIELPNYTGRNYHLKSSNTQKDIVVIRKNSQIKDVDNNYINYCTKSINSNRQINKMNITFHNYINEFIDTPVIKVNLKKHIKSTSQLMKFINVNSKNNPTKNSKNKLKNKSFIGTSTKRSINTSQLVKELLNKKKEIKSAKNSNNNNSTILKISKTTKEKSILIKKLKTTPKYNKVKKGENFSAINKKNNIESNIKKYYSIKYELNLRNNGSSKLERNQKPFWNKKNKTKNNFKPKTQSDIKSHKFQIKEENKQINNDEEIGMDKRVKQKLLDKMNKVSKNTFSNIWGNKKKNENSSENIISPNKNKEYLFTHKNFYNKKIISNENSQNEEKESKKDKIIEKRNQNKFKIINDYIEVQINNEFF